MMSPTTYNIVLRPELQRSLGLLDGGFFASASGDAFAQGGHGECGNVRRKIGSIRINIK